ncbi:IclR family transcriptional regulator [Natranaerobius trueperi]|uniref:Glycerol operon regulatory protein n=2 Tax=Natranaerobius trueperi TaxID=759412 RepID=A0A226C138_9FIRM|nr:IclR family transcriptional regulator [Natranaerobius trueperi]
MEKEKPKKELIKSVSRSLDLLSLFLEHKQELGVSQISKKLGVYKSTTHRLLDTLKEKGFVYQNPITQKYWLGVKNFSLGMLYQNKLVLTELSYPYLKELSEQWHETIHLAILDESEKPEVVVLEKVKTNHLLTFSPPIGSTTPAHCSGVGKVLLAYSSPDTTNNLFKSNIQRFTDTTITKKDDLKTELEKIKEVGYAIDREELEKGLSCFAVPVFSRDNEVVAAISISGPTSRITPDRHEEIINS